MSTTARPRNSKTLALLGQQLRSAREAAGLSQSRIKNMRQGTVSKIENGLDVTLDTFLTHVAALGLEVALLPIGQAALSRRPAPWSEQNAPIDLLTEFEHLKDPSS